MPTKTGGVTAAIEDNVNGYSISINATVVDYTYYISQLLNNNRNLKELSESSRLKFERELNGNVWSKKVKTILSNCAQL